MIRILFLFSLALTISASALADCYPPWGGMPVQEGQWITAYQEERPTGGRRCQSEMRFCNGGFLSGMYRFQRCQEDFGCDVYPWGYIYNGGSVTAYRNSLETGGRKCEKEIRTCSYGRLSGWFTNRNCSEI